MATMSVQLIVDNILGLTAIVTVLYLWYSVVWWIFSFVCYLTWFLPTFLSTVIGTAAAAVLGVLYPGAYGFQWFQNEEEKKKHDGAKTKRDWPLSVWLAMNDEPAMNQNSPQYPPRATFQQPVRDQPAAQPRQQSTSIFGLSEEPRSRPKPRPELQSGLQSSLTSKRNAESRETREEWHASQVRANKDRLEILQHEKELRNWIRKLFEDELGRAESSTKGGEQETAISDGDDEENPLLRIFSDLGDAESESPTTSATENRVLVRVDHAESKAPTSPATEDRVKSFGQVLKSKKTWKAQRGLQGGGANQPVSISPTLAAFLGLPNADTEMHVYSRCKFIKFLHAYIADLRVRRGDEKGKSFQTDKALEALFGYGGRILYFPDKEGVNELPGLNALVNEHFYHGDKTEKKPKRATKSRPGQAEKKRKEPDDLESDHDLQPKGPPKRTSPTKKLKPDDSDPPSEKKRKAPTTDSDDGYSSDDPADPTYYPSRA